jgi:hypothetical protein
VDDVGSELIDLAVDGLVKLTPGEFGGWSVTEAGRETGAERIAEELRAADARAIVAGAFDRFLVLNPKLLEICTAWQMRPIGDTTTVNDHTDHVYDDRIFVRLTELHARALRLCLELSVVLDRFAPYGERLSGALARAEAGAHDFVADNMSSYHSVWFQLHEDLLVTLGIPRTH